MAYQWNDSDCERIADEAAEVERAIDPGTSHDRLLIMTETLTRLIYDLAIRLDTVLLATKLACKE